MSRDVSVNSLRNLWGVQSVAGANALEPQRVDLFLVDFTNAVAELNAAAGIQLSPVEPQFVKSVSIPDLKIKAEVIAKNSIPVHFPSWDEPVEPAKISFLLDTYSAEDKSAVLDMLDTWIALTRAGHGKKFGGFGSGSQETGYFLLDSTFRTNCRFDIQVKFLRGKLKSAQAAPVDLIPQVNGEVAASRLNEAATQHDIFARYTVPNSSILEPDMEEHMRIVLRKAWCAGYKVSDLNYGDSQLVTVDAIFYPEATERGTLPAFIGSAKTQGS